MLSFQNWVPCPKKRNKVKKPTVSLEPAEVKVFSLSKQSSPAPDDDHVWSCSTAQETSFSRNAAMVVEMKCRGVSSADNRATEAVKRRVCNLSPETLKRMKTRAKASSPYIWENNETPFSAKTHVLWIAYMKMPAGSFPFGTACIHSFLQESLPRRKP